MTGLVRALGCVVLVALLVAACADYGRLRELEALTESDLPPFPGATLVGETAAPERPGVEGPDRAKMERVFRADATHEQVVAYYEALLVPLGWDQIGVNGTWRKGQFGILIQELPPSFATPDQPYAWEEQLTNQEP